MYTRMTKYALALGVAGTMAIAAATPSLAAPVLSNTAAVKSVAPAQAEIVRYRRGFGGPGAIVGGLALGFAGAALAAPYYYGQPAYGYGPAYGPAYYDSDYGPPGYAYAPAPYYVGPRWHHRHHW